MFIVANLPKLITAPEEPHIRAAHCAPLERGFKGGAVGYKHLAALRPNPAYNSNNTNTA